MTKALTRTKAKPVSKSPAASPQPPQLRPLPAAPASPAPNPLLRFGGSKEFPAHNGELLRRTLATGWVTTNTEEGQNNAITMTMAQLEAFGPKNAVEGMLAAQAVALHNASMECLRRAMIPEQGSAVSSTLRKDAANLSRAMVEMTEALQRRRGKGPQVMRIERVVVQEGGQAIVGNVNRGDGN